MKSLSYFLVIMFVTTISACGQKHKSNEHAMNMNVSGIDTTMKKTTIKFVSTEHNFGKVQEGEKVSHVFEVSNTGKTDLLLQSVKPSCGCTTPKYDKKPIRPGKKGTIEVEFDTKGRPGIQRKTVLVVTNTEPPNTVLIFSCDVIPANKEK